MSWKIGGFNTLLLIISSVTMVMAWASLKNRQLSRGRGYLGVTMVLGFLFLMIKLFLEYRPHWHEGDVPSQSVFFGIYYVMTGLHGLHVLGGVLVMAYLLGPGRVLWQQNKDHYTNRIECTGLYWHFVDLVWIFLFPTLYLMN